MSPWLSKLQMPQLPSRHTLQTLWQALPVYLGTEPKQFSQIALTAVFEQWCAAHAGARCQVLLGGNWIHPLCAPVEPWIWSQADLLAYAKQQFEYCLGQNEPLHVSVSRYAPVPLACACSASLIADLLQSARLHGVQIVAVLPWWAGAAQVALQASTHAAGELLARDTSVSTRLSWRTQDQQRRLVDIQLEYGDFTAVPSTFPDDAQLNRLNGCVATSKWLPPCIEIGHAPPL